MGCQAGPEPVFQIESSGIPSGSDLSLQPGPVPGRYARSDRRPLELRGDRSMSNDESGFLDTQQTAAYLGLFDLSL